MVTFTVPEPLRPFLRRHQTIGYGALFAASSGAIKTLAVDPRHIGGDVPGFFGVLHTWGRTLPYHPHIHYVVVGGALSSTDGRWHPARPGFYLPVRAVSRIVRAKFRDQIDKRGLLGDIPPEVWAVEWNSIVRPPATAARPCSTWRPTCSRWRSPSTASWPSMPTTCTFGIRSRTAPGCAP